jgi:hypothetical protein
MEGNNKRKKASYWRWTGRFLRLRWVKWRWRKRRRKKRREEEGTGENYIYTVAS